MAIIEVTHLTKVYGQQVACRDICLSVEEGQIFGLLGPNGAGKSTLVKMLVGLVYPTAGMALVAGYAPTDTRSRQQVGFLPENFRLHGWLKGSELVNFHARLAGLDYRSAKRRAQEALEMVGLAKEAEKLVANYSKGMQQRLGLAAALVGDPRVVFLDEPTSALDPLGRREVREILLSLKAAGKTENGTLYPLAARPLTRRDLLLGKYFGLAAMLVTYAALFFLSLVGLVYWQTGLLLPGLWVAPPPSTSASSPALCCLRTRCTGG